MCAQHTVKYMHITMKCVHGTLWNVCTAHCEMCAHYTEMCAQHTVKCVHSTLWNVCTAHCEMYAITLWNVCTSHCEMYAQHTVKCMHITLKCVHSTLWNVCTSHCEMFAHHTVKCVHITLWNVCTSHCEMCAHHTVKCVHITGNTQYTFIVRSMSAFIALFLFKRIKFVKLSSLNDTKPSQCQMSLLYLSVSICKLNADICCCCCFLSELCPKSRHILSQYLPPFTVSQNVFCSDIHTDANSIYESVCATTLAVACNYVIIWS